MAKLNSLFKTFLSNIEPDQAATEYAQEAHKRVRECLEKDDVLGESVSGSFLYGSYKRHTAVGDIKDVDVVILTDFDIGNADNTPQRVLRRFKSALGRCYDDPENPEYQRRSIRVNDPLPDKQDSELTLDIIPAAVITDDHEKLRVPDREVSKWIWSHPRGHLEHSTQLNSDECGDGRYVPLVKIMKWWWKYQCEIRQPDVERPKPKGFWVECLTGENFDSSQHDWADHFIAVLENVSEKYTEATEVPALTDPGLKGETIKTSMTLDEFQLFMEAVNESLDLARSARDDSDPITSSELWREVFGEEYPLHDPEESEETRKEAQSTVLDKHPHVEALRWEYKPQKSCKVRLDAFLYFGKKRRGGINSNGRVIPSGWKIEYVAKTRARGSYEVYWQVVNTGEHAKKANQLRGEFFQAELQERNSPDNPLVNQETTQYTGKHWVECFIVKDGVCVARSGKFFVAIKNPNSS